MPRVQVPAEAPDDVLAQPARRHLAGEALAHLGDVVGATPPEQRAADRQLRVVTTVTVA